MSLISSTQNIQCATFIKHKKKDIQIASIVPPINQYKREFLRNKSTSLNVSNDVVSDIIIIGSGIGGLSCASLLSKYGYDVSICEAHSIAGGCAHTWKRREYHFDTGASLFFGLSPPLDIENPLAVIFKIIKENVDMIKYDESKTKLFWSDRSFDTQIGSNEFDNVIETLWGPMARKEWKNLQIFCKRSAKRVSHIHPMAVRYDAGIALTTMIRSPLNFTKYLFESSNLYSIPFSTIVDRIVHDKNLKIFINTLCKGTFGLPTNEISASYMIRAFNQLYQKDSKYEYPIGGSQSIVNALLKGLNKCQTKLFLNAKVVRILTKNKKAIGVVLSNGKTLYCKKAIVSNATVWNTYNLIEEKEDISHNFKNYIKNLELNDSFIHLHIAFDGSNLNDLPLHTYFFDEQSFDGGWPTICIPSTLDPVSFAPKNKHVLHVYQSESYEKWDGMDRRSIQYKKLKEECSLTLWKYVKRLIPDIHDRIEMEFIGSPLTHEKYLNRYKGTYGPKNLLKINKLPQPISPLKNIYCCGDSTFPGIGTPAVAASSMWLANSLVPIWNHWNMLNYIDL